MSLPDLDPTETSRYYKALASWFAISLVGTGIGFFIGAIAAFIYIKGIDALVAGSAKDFLRFLLHPQSNTSQTELIGFGLVLGLGLAGGALGNLVWYLIFIRSGYLSANTTQRLRVNQAPTQYSEKIRVTVGYVFYIGFFLSIGLYFLLQKDRGPLEVVVSFALIGVGVSYFFHAYFRYRKK